MAASGATFYTSLRAMLKLSEQPLLTDQFPPSNPHNIGARLLRHGLSVSAFSLLEKYVEHKFSDLILAIAASRLPYASLPDSLRKFIIVDAVSGLSNKLNFLDDADRQHFAETNVSLIASFSNPSAHYTSFGFSPRGSNIGHEDIRKAYISCGVEKPWEKLSRITTEIGARRLSLSVDFRNLAKTRHSSAHNPEGNVPTADLRTHIETAILIGIAIALLSSAASVAYEKSRTLTGLKVALANLSPSYRFIDEQQDGFWLERNSSGGRAFKRYPNEIAAARGATARATARMVVCRDIQRVPIALLL